MVLKVLTLLVFFTPLCAWSKVKPVDKISVERFTMTQIRSLTGGTPWDYKSSTGYHTLRIRS